MLGLYTSPISKGHTMGIRRHRLVAAAGAVVAIWAGPLAAQSLAVQYWSTGATGTSTTSVGYCRFYDYARDLGLTTPSPSIYARNNRYGAGNDWQWVRFRTHLQNRYTGAWSVVGWSEWAVAYDNSPARFSSPNQGFQHLSSRYPHSYRLEVRIEWWNQTSMLGAVAHRISPYRYSFGGGWSGYYDYCGYIGEYGSGQALGATSAPTGSAGPSARSAGPSRDGAPPPRRPARTG